MKPAIVSFRGRCKPTAMTMEGQRSDSNLGLSRLADASGLRRVRGLRSVAELGVVSRRALAWLGKFEGFVPNFDCGCNIIVVVCCLAPAREYHHTPMGKTGKSFASRGFFYDRLLLTLLHTSRCVSRTSALPFVGPAHY